jgi:hypothetical protein
MKYILGLVLSLCLVVPLFGQPAPTNQGIALPNNGPCSPALGYNGICTDQTGSGNGVLTFYTNTGQKYTLADLQGAQGVPGPPGIQGIQGVPGIAVGDVIGGTVTLTCGPDIGGTIPKGFTSLCTFSNFTITSLSQPESKGVAWVTIVRVPDGSWYPVMVGKE